MRFLQELNDENARFEIAKAQHELALSLAKRNMLEKIVKFAQEHIIGEVIIEGTQRKIYGDWSDYESSCHDTANFLGRYFTIGGEPTNLYLVRQTLQMRPCHMYWSTKGGKTTTKIKGLCFEEKNPASLEELAQKLKEGNVEYETLTMTNPIFSFDSCDVINTDWNKVRGYFTDSKNSGYLSRINIDELGINAEEYKNLIDSLLQGPK